jgi:hypothetical protein
MEISLCQTNSPPRSGVNKGERLFVNGNTGSGVAELHVWV